MPTPHRPSPSGAGLRLGMLSTSPPTECGLATFNAALLTELDEGSGSVGVVRVLDTPEPVQGAGVVGHLVRGSGASTRDAAERLNGFDAVIVQHEYGIYGGPDGARRPRPARRR